MKDRISYEGEFLFEIINHDIVDVVLNGNYSKRFKFKKEDPFLQMSVFLDSKDFKMYKSNAAIAYQLLPEDQYYYAIFKYNHSCLINERLLIRKEIGEKHRAENMSLSDEMKMELNRVTRSETSELSPVLIVRQERYPMVYINRNNNIHLSLDKLTYINPQDLTHKSSKIFIEIEVTDFKLNKLINSDILSLFHEFNNDRNFNSSECSKYEEGIKWLHDIKEKVIL
ncbi:hypothetical protein [Bacillus pseudomycoides]|uniref:hypothetical protein n=1 Tax=Bacillus pseudomycoides TaxID=64104 RepID=UPI000BFD847E|nr:hypothetical protein [Bacillus pseudomycoides]MED1625119.1 hypothetical protein [Bacillus pseudomycoides]PHC41195.1 hypothetical protein COF01_04855 [Bacillus pseudomycoides]